MKERHASSPATPIIRWKKCNNILATALSVMLVMQLVLIVSPERSKAKERIVYFGRRTNPQEENPAQMLKAAIDFVKTNEVPAYLNVSGFLSNFLMKWKLSNLAQKELQNIEKAYIMDQSGVPAFLFMLKDAPRKTARILFFRKSSMYEVQLIADKDFQSILPQDFFAKSFLSQKLSDAQEYTGRELSKIKMDQSNSANLSPLEIQWPMALLAANLSVSPKSIESFFHFAGISALLYKSASLPANDTEITDILRNNVLACDLYAKDVAPDSTKAAEIANLARALIKSFEPDSR